MPNFIFIRIFERVFKENLNFIINSFQIKHCSFKKMAEYRRNLCGILAKNCPARPNSSSLRFTTLAGTPKNLSRLNNYVKVNGPKIIINQIWLKRSRLTQITLKIWPVFLMVLRMNKFPVLNLWGIFFTLSGIDVNAEPSEPKNNPMRQLWRNRRRKVKAKRPFLLQ